MLHSIFSVFDSKAAAFLPPFIMPRASMAQRVFSDCVNSADHQFAAHPEDYTLFILGTFDDETAEFSLNKTGPRSLGLALEYVKREDDGAQMDLISATEGPSNGKAHDSPQQVSTSVQPDRESGDKPV